MMNSWVAPKSELAEVDVGDKGLLIAVHTDVTDTGRGNHTQHAVHQTETGTEDGHHGKLLACQRGHIRLAKGGLNMFGLPRRV